MGKKIYVITSGEYSDYQIVAIYTTREMADEFVQCNGDGYEIEEYDLNKPISNKKKLWVISFNIESGELEHATTNDYINNENYKDICFYCDSYMDVARMHLYVESETMDKAKKIACDRFASIKANQYIWLRLTRPYDVKGYGTKLYEKYNIRTNEFIKE